MVIQSNPNIESMCRIEIISKIKNRTIMTAYNIDVPIGECVRDHVIKLEKEDYDQPRTM